MNENATMSKLIGVAVTLTVSVILIASLVVPAITDAQRESGPEVIFNNSTDGANYRYSVWAGENVTLAWNTDDGYSVNGENVPITRLHTIAIASNAFSARTAGTSSNPSISSQYIEETVSNPSRAFTFAVDNGDYTLNLAGNEYSGTLDWFIYINPAGDRELTKPSNLNKFYTSYSDDIIVLGNIYVTGEEDTYYSYYNGKLSVNEEYADTAKANVTKTLVDGTTDVYETAITVTIQDETFTPNYILVNLHVVGHEATGAVYSLYAVIPVMLLVALLYVGVSVVRNKE